MPRYIIKLTKGDQNRYLEWSTIVDAPVTMGMTLEQFKVYYLHEYGRQGSQDLAERLARVEAQGHSLIPDAPSSWGPYTLKDLVAHNRAGPRGGHLDIDKLWEYYCKPKEETAT